MLATIDTTKPISLLSDMLPLMSLEDNRLTLPSDIQFDRNGYLNLKKVLTKAGAKYFRSGFNFTKVFFITVRYTSFDRARSTFFTCYNQIENR